MKASVDEGNGEFKALPGAEEGGGS